MDQQITPEGAPESADIARQYRETLNPGQRPTSSSSATEDPSATIPAQEPPAKDIAMGSVTKLLQLVDVADPENFGSIMTFPLDRFNPRKTRKARLDKKWSEAAIIVRRHVEAGQIITFTIEINSDMLQTELRRVAKLDQFRDVRNISGTMIIPYPFRSLFHGRKKIEEAIQKAKDDNRDKLSDQLTLLQEFLLSPEALGELIREHESLLEQGKVTFETLWALYPPRELVFQLRDGAARCYRVEDVWLDIFKGRYVLMVSLLSMLHDGRRGGIVRSDVRIPWFDGTARINAIELPLLPLRFLSPKDEADIKDFLVERGKKYVELQTARKSYREAGTFWGRIKEDELVIENERNMARSNFRVVVDAGAARDAGKAPRVTFLAANWEEYEQDRDGLSDATGSNSRDGDAVAPDEDGDVGSGDPKEASRMDPVLQMPLKKVGKKRRSSRSRSRSLDRALRERRRRSSSNSDSSEDKNQTMELAVHGDGGDNTKVPSFSDNDYLLGPVKTLAFLLDKKKWVQVSISDLYRIKFYSHPFNALQLDTSKKRLIRALVRGFTANGLQSFKGFDDIVQGKGKGLFFLLHGDSGLGKTFTAEVIAEETRRPLYRISTGELGIGIKEMEDRLTEVFKLGRRWGAVVLLDEADVLVTKRTDNELARNAVVAMFLNLVEYYEGILFVTTNRESAFDEAFKNRMHAILKFPKLDETARHKIWRNLIVDRPNPLPLDASWSEHQDELKVLAKIDLNGRDIRNMIRTAWAYASSVEKDLGVRHIVTVLQEVCRPEILDDVKAITGELRPALDRVRTSSLEDANDHPEVSEDKDSVPADVPATPILLIGGFHIKW